MDINNPVHQSNVRRGHEFANISLDGNVGAHFGDVIIQNEIAADGFIRADIRKQELLSALAYHGMSTRRRQLAQHSAENLEWIWDGKEVGGPSFTDWLCSDAPLYWVTGKPGSGKSTLIKYVVENKLTEQLLSISRHPQWTVVHFYFDFRAATSIPNTLEGLLRSFLFQLAAANPVAEKSMQYDRDGRETDFRHADLHLDELRRMIRMCIAAIKSSHSVCAFLDGLDEYAGKPTEVIRMVEFLKKAGVSKICCASRSENVLVQHFADKPHLRMHDRNYNTIRAFVSETLSDVPSIPSALSMQDLIKDVVERSQGVILWSHLVCGHLVDGFFEGETSVEILARLDHFPQELNEAYNRLLSSVDSSKETETAILLSLIESATDVHKTHTIWALHRAMTYLTHVGILPSWPKGKVKLNSFLLRLQSRMGSMIDIVSLSSRTTNMNLLYSKSSNEIHDRFQSHDFSVRLFHRTLQTYISTTGWTQKILGKNAPSFDHKSPWLSLSLDCLERYTLTDRGFSQVFRFLQSTRQQTVLSQHQADYEFEDEQTHALALALFHTEVVESDLAFLDCALAILPTFRDLSITTTHSTLIQFHVLRDILRPFEGPWLRCWCYTIYTELDKQFLTTLLQFTPTERSTIFNALHAIAQESWTWRILRDSQQQIDPAILALFGLPEWDASTAGRVLSIFRGQVFNFLPQVQLLIKKWAQLVIQSYENEFLELIDRDCSSLSTLEFMELMFCFQEWSVGERFWSACYDTWRKAPPTVCVHYDVSFLPSEISNGDCNLLYFWVWNAIGLGSPVGDNILDCTLTLASQELLNFLLSRGFDLNLACSRYGPLLHSSLRMYAVIEYKPRYKFGHLIEVVLSHGAKARETGPHGTALETAHQVYDRRQDLSCNYQNVSCEYRNLSRSQRSTDGRRLHEIRRVAKCWHGMMLIVIAMLERADE